ncbi:MAG: cupin domain-containing protein [Desulfomonilia bacterium]
MSGINMTNIANWKDVNTIEDGCGGTIYKILDVENSGLKSLEIVMCIFSPGEVAKLHYHQRMEEIYYVLDGEGEVELNGKWFKVRADDSVAIPIGTTHRMKNTSSDKVLRFLSVNSPEWILSDMITITENEIS